MTEWLLTHKPTFLRELLGLSAKESHQVQGKLSLLQQDPTPDGKLKKQLKNWTPPIYRLRCGDYRVFYAFQRPHISLLALRRRSEDTYDEDIESEHLGGYAPQPSPHPPIREAQWGTMLTAQAATPLPAPIDLQLLRRLRIPEQFHRRLLQVKTEEELLASIEVPDELLLQLDEVIFLRPLMDVVNQPDFISASVDDLFRFKEGTLAGFLLKLSPEQEHLVSLNIGGGSPTLVKGGPGSGKSTVALYRAAHLARRLASDGQQARRILFTTYTSALVAFSRGLLGTMLGDGAGDVEVATVDSIAAKILSETGKPRRPASQEQLLDAVRKARQDVGVGANALERLRSRSRLEHLTDDYLIEEMTSLIEARDIASIEQYLANPRTGREEQLNEMQRRLVWQIKELFDRRLKEQGVRSWSAIRRDAARVAPTGNGIYDAVIIDEAQDLEPAALKILIGTLRKQGEIFLTADANQSIYSSSFRWSEVHRGLEASGTVATLSANFRSTREIALAAYAYVNGAGISTELDQTFVHEGPLPAMRKVRTLDDEIALLDRFIRGASRELRITLGSAAILCPSSRDGERLAAALTAKGLPASFMLSKDLDVHAPGVKVLPLRAAKGLEFPIVAIAGLWPPYPHFPVNSGRAERDERLKLERRILFVAMTRAMRTLLVVVPESSSSSLLETFDAKLWNLSRS